jgi:hypothetical protein
MPPYNDYRYMPIRDAAILTTSYVAGNVIGVKAPPYMAGPVGLYNQLILYVDFTKGSLTTAELLIEFSDNQTDWYQETVDDIAAATGIITEHNAVRTLTATGKYRIPIKINDQFIRVSIKGTGTVTSSSVAINAIIGNN